VTDGDKYKTNLSHSTWNANLDFQSGYAADMLIAGVVFVIGFVARREGDFVRVAAVAVLRHFNRGYKTNLSHSTWNANLDFQSGYAADMFGLDIAAFTGI
jgi:hypothetical protein